MLHRVFLARHGETEWSRSGRHTGRTDIALSEQGELNAGLLAGPMAGVHFGRVLTSPRRRARRTCELAGLGAAAEVEPDLAEWDYGDYEGLTSAEILSGNPGWRLFRDGCPGGESPAQVSHARIGSSSGFGRWRARSPSSHTAISGGRSRPGG